MDPLGVLFNEAFLVLKPTTVTERGGQVVQMDVSLRRGEHSPVEVITMNCLDFRHASSSLLHWKYRTAFTTGRYCPLKPLVPNGMPLWTTDGYFESLVST